MLPIFIEVFSLLKSLKKMKKEKYNNLIKIDKQAKQT